MKIVACILIAFIVGIEIVSMIVNNKKKFRRIEKVYTGKFLGIEFKKQTTTLSTDPVFYKGKDIINIPKSWKLFYYEDEEKGETKYILCEPYTSDGYKNLSEGTRILVKYEGSKNFYLRKILDKSTDNASYIWDDAIKYVVKFEKTI